MITLQTTPLYEIHKQLHAKIAPFGNWEMPIQYSGIIEERTHCRNKAALFDTCHMGELYFKGDIKGSGLEYAFCFSLSDIAEGSCRYGFLLHDNGGIADDLIVYRLAADELMMIVNANTIEKDFSLIQEHLQGDYIFEDRSDITAKIDLQGPISRSILVELIGKEIEEIKYFHFKTLPILGEKSIISRTGYTGEIGYELYISTTRVVELWRNLLHHPDIKPAGLGARDLLRIEMGYSLYGSDIDDTTTPLEAGLAMFVNFDKEFRGKDALLLQQSKGISRTKVAFQTDSRRSPRQHYTIYNNGNCIGEVTSGIYSPYISCGIGLGYVQPEYARDGASIQVGTESLKLNATMSKLPFYKDGTVRT